MLVRVLRPKYCRRLDMWVASEIMLVIVCVGIICGISVLWNKIPKSENTALFTRLLACALMILLSIFGPGTSNLLVVVATSIFIATLVDFYKKLKSNRASTVT